ncbi:3-hydroxyacyl-CoA dehydrogenase family protein [Streptomyces sp. NRRL S-350]|uniref:3-hydroxyacyl-CoA dehydrogenase family protein n=1 Tax=Streptomyces sp. NRRL S-350 TaxID=1463902 RepID=UPI00099BD65E|nr:3-hydroxyacyl-CoA dehydrogenase family protein [Streptomyces sp. NRRL S-350]
MPFTVPDPTGRPVAVVGAGTLGRRIALMFATGGGEVRIYDPSAEQRAAARAYVEEQLPAVAAGIDAGRPGTVTTGGDLAEVLPGAWLVIEAVPERPELKQRVFADLDRIADEDAILGSNSSSYPTSRFVDSVREPQRLVNIHFYMPPTQNAVDVMSCGLTDRGVIDLLLAELPRHGVFPFEARKESTGFIFNRIWAAIKRESLAVVAEGVATAEEVDAMWAVNTGLRGGPFRAMDQVGLDVVLDIEEHYAAERPGLPTGPRALLEQYVGEGRLGVKAGRGFYDYRPGAGAASGAADRMRRRRSLTAVPRPRPARRLARGRRAAPPSEEREPRTAGRAQVTHEAPPVDRRRTERQCPGPVHRARLPRHLDP